MATFAKFGFAFAYLIVGGILGAIGLYIGQIDDAPGAVLIGLLLMLAVWAIGVATWIRLNGSEGR